MTRPHQRLCPLCGAASNAYHRDRSRCYHQCPACKLVFVDREQLLSPAAARAVYDLHRNDPGDLGYRTFLSRIFRPLAQRLPPGAEGLDFGCGPGPALPVMFGERGHGMAVYDPFYFPDATVLDRTYDFVTATEVVEHMARPSRDLSILWRCVKPGGILGIMTKLVRGPSSFATWHYIRDATHISFFSSATFEWLGRRWQTRPRIIGDDVILFHKRALHSVAPGRK